MQVHYPLVCQSIILFIPVLSTIICRSYINLYADPTYDMPVHYTLIYQSDKLLYDSPLCTYMSVLYILISLSVILLYACPTYYCMPILYILICRCYIFLYARPSKSYKPVRYTLICQSYIL